MSNSNFTTTLLVDQSPEQVYNAVMNVRGWWDGEIEGNAEKLNNEFTYQVGKVHFSKQKVVELIPQKKVVWLVAESNLNFIGNKSEWTGTKICFEISKHENKTKLTFIHQGLVPDIECFKDCSNAWRQIVQQSLLSLITTGKGVKVF